MTTILDAVKWQKYNNHEGPVYRGSLRYNPKKPWGAWERILGCIARCEGSHDTVVMYDGTGVTWGFQQWTMTSGRLQKVLQSLKAIPYQGLSVETNEGKDDQDVEQSDKLSMGNTVQVRQTSPVKLFTGGVLGLISRLTASHPIVENYVKEPEPMMTLFDKICCRNDRQIFEDFGFKIESGKFIDLSAGKALDPTIVSHRTKINNICLGKLAFPANISKQKEFAKALCAECAVMAQFYGVPEAQISYAAEELKRALTPKRSPLGKYSTIENLLGDTLETPVAGLFFNLWQNNPGATYKLFIRARNELGKSYSKEDYLRVSWRLLNNSTFGNWSYKSAYHLKNGGTPRIVRIRSAIQEFYDRDLAITR